MKPDMYPATAAVNAVLDGVRCAVAFNRKGYVRSVKSRARACRQAMLRIVWATGLKPPRQGVVTLSAERRALEERWRSMALLVVMHCGECPYSHRRECKGANPFD